MFGDKKRRQETDDRLQMLEERLTRNSEVIAEDHDSIVSLKLQLTRAHARINLLSRKVNAVREKVRG